jgi:hypothetical protein
MGYKWTFTDADQSYDVTIAFGILPTITANRTLTFPSPTNYVGRKIIIWNKNSSGFTWNVSGTVIDAADNSISSLTNDTIYEFISDGTSWIKK